MHLESIQVYIILLKYLTYIKQQDKIYTTKLKILILKGEQALSEKVLLTEIKL